MHGHTMKLIMSLFIHAEWNYDILIIVQRDATQSSLFIILQVHSTCFGCQTNPSSGVHKTVTTASGTGHIFCAATSLQRGQAYTRNMSSELAEQKIDCFVLHLFGQLLIQISDALNQKHKINYDVLEHWWGKWTLKFNANIFSTVYYKWRNRYRSDLPSN